MFSLGSLRGYTDPRARARRVRPGFLERSGSLWLIKLKLYFCLSPARHAGAEFIVHYDQMNRRLPRRGLRCSRLLLPEMGRKFVASVRLAEKNVEAGAGNFESGAAGTPIRSRRRSRRCPTALMKISAVREGARKCRFVARRLAGRYARGANNKRGVCRSSFSRGSSAEARLDRARSIRRDRCKTQRKTRWRRVRETRRPVVAPRRD